MEKHTYIQAKNRGDIGILYEYYKEHFIPEKHGALLSFQDFMSTIHMWGPVVIPNMLRRAIEYYDQKFHVTKLMAENGQIIKEY
jgi:hypothetical protein